MRSIFMAACLLAPLLAGGAQASEGGFLAGIAAGTARSELSDSFRNTLSSGFGSVRLHEDKSDFAARLLLGYQFNRNFSIEGAYGRYGKVEGRAETAFPLGQVSVSREVNAFTLDAVGSVPLSDRLDLSLKLGVAAWRLENSTTTVLPVASVASGYTNRQSGVSPHFGVGLQYSLSDTTRLTFDVEQFRAGKSDGAGRSQVNTVFVGLKFNF